MDELRSRWQELLDLAQEVTHTLLKERRSAFEQELDKQVKGFVVEVIQFRNAFDAQGPAVPGKLTVIATLLVYPRLWTKLWDNVILLSHTTTILPYM